MGISLWEEEGREERDARSRVTNKVKGFTIYKNSCWLEYGRDDISIVGWLTRDKPRVVGAIPLQIGSWLKSGSNHSNVVFNEKGWLVLSRALCLFGAVLR